MKLIKIILISLLFINILNGDDFNIDNLLKEIEKKTDLSSKTRLANSGIRIIYTRDELASMQAHSLKDVLKTMHPVGYKENHYGVPDPYRTGTAIPFMSSTIRIYIDNQEMISGNFGSGLALYGDMDIDFVNHIELYYGSPTYEFSTEPAVLIIKLYSKVAQKDEGSKVSISSGSYGANSINFYNSKELKDWSYFIYASNANLKRKKYTSNNTKLSRDKKRNHIFGSFYKKNHNILVDAVKQKGDGFIGPSIDATPLKNTVAQKSLHIGYDGTIDNISFLFTYDYNIIDNYFKDDLSSIPIVVSSFEAKTKSNVYTSGIKYKKIFPNNEFITGISYRIKNYTYPVLTKNNIVASTNGKRFSQKLTTIFIENQYFINKNSIFTTGLNYIKVKNKDSVQQDELNMYRIGHTYTNNNWIVKTINSYFETSLEPYLIKSYTYLADPDKKYEKSKQNIFAENIIYEENNNRYELIASHITTKNRMMPDASKGGRLDNYKKTLRIKSILGKFLKKYNNYDSFEFLTSVSEITNLPEVNRLKTYKVSIKSIIDFDKYTIFNKISYSKDNQVKQDYYDYTASVKYNYSKDLTISLKGTNLFDKGYKNQFKRYKQITSSPYLVEDTPVEVSPIEKSITINMEYTF